MLCSMQGCVLTRQKCHESNINMFLFPSIPKQRRIWMTSCQVQGELPQDAFVCALHFNAEDVMRLGNSYPKCIPAQEETSMGACRLRGESSKDDAKCVMPEYNDTFLNKDDISTHSSIAMISQCRSCSTTDSSEFIDMLTATTDSMNVYDYFNECTQLSASAEDELPGTLCGTCAHDLNVAYNFRQEARRSDASLRLILTSKVQAGMVPQSELTLMEQAAVVETESNSNDKPELKTMDPLGGIDVIERKPNIEEILIEIDDDIKRKLKKEQPAIVELKVAEKSGEEPLDVESRRQSCISADSAELSCVASQMESEATDEDWHVTSHNKGARANKRKAATKCLTCQFCQSTLPNLNRLRKHLIEVHKSEVTCEECPKNFNYPHELQQHNELVHAENSPVQCHYCPGTPNIPRSELVNHFRLKHCHRYNKYFPKSKSSQRETRFQCSVCLRYFISAVLLSDHMHVHANDKPYKCRFCPMDFNMKRSFQAHLKRKHDVTGCVAAFQREIEGKVQSENTPTKYFPRSRRKETEIPTQFQCGICKRYCPSAALLSDHLHCHADDKPYQCSHCPMRFNMKRTYQAHLKRKHGIGGSLKANAKEDPEDSNKLIQCAECKKELSPVLFRRHKAWHDRKKKMKTFLCSYCPRLFNNKVVMHSHEKKIHLNEKPATKECTICRKSFQHSYLAVHIRKVHANERNFACHICGNAFKSQTQLDNHLKLHGEREFKCSVCQKKYIRQCDLKVHMRSHTGEQPYSCDICGKRFSVKVRLTYHLQRHAGVKHRCNECGKEFNQIKMLRQHSYKHTGMPYRCPSCGYSCVLRDVFTRHLRRMHSIVMTEHELRAMFKQNTGRMPRIPTIDELKSIAAKTTSI